MTDEAIEPFHVGEQAKDQANRQRILGLVAKIPGLIDAGRRLSPGKAFRVVMSEGNAHLFKQAADGAWKPHLHNGKHFVENVDLFPIPPDYAGIISSISMMLNMAVIAGKLEAIEVGVQNINRLLVDRQRGKVKGALDALSWSRALENPDERRQQMLSACRDVIIELRALASQLSSNIAAMPNEETGLLKGFIGDGIARAQAAHEQVEDDIDQLIRATSLLLRACDDLGEPRATTAALSGIVEGLREAGLPDAIRKSRLLPYKANNRAPEQRLQIFLDSIESMHANSPDGERWKREPISIDIKPEELSLA